MIKRGEIFWLTGMSGVGKTTLVDAARDRLEAEGHIVISVDGDDVRRTTSRDLGFTKEDIIENNARIVDACSRQRKAADVIFVPVIAPYASSRAKARRALEPGYSEIFVSAPLSTLRDRDVKGLYARQARGELDNLVGVSPGSPYEPPKSPDLHIDTGQEKLEISVDRLLAYINARLNSRGRQ
jgi:adenylyl-sulfate kinase